MTYPASMKYSRWYVLHWVILGIVPVYLSGCAAPILVATLAPSAGLAAAQAGSAAYVAGELRVARFVSMEDAWQATLAAVDELELTVQVERIGERRRYVMARDDNRLPEMRIRLDRRSAMMTKVSIRVGVLGDPAVAKLLLQHIDNHLIEMQEI